jgi:ketosteroid isomerase-like protein
MLSKTHALALVAAGSLATHAALAQDRGAESTTPAAQAAPIQVDADPVVAELLRRSHEGNAALLRGDLERYRLLIPVAPDFTLMSPFGGRPTRGSEMTEARWQAVGRFFRNGGLEQEVVQTYATSDMVVLAIIERANVEVGGLAAQDWPLRVTLVYRRDGDDWRLVHRHADPLASGISVRQSAALARSEPAVD